MVTKLFKYEIRSYWRSLAPIWAVLVGVGALTRLVRFFESESNIYGIVSGSAYAALGIGIVAVIALTVILVIRRFYTNLYTAEGYLSFTLPVTPFQHINVKLWTAMLFTVASALVAVAAFALALAGDLLTEVWRMLVYYCRVSVRQLGADRFLLTAVEIVLIALCAAATFYLLVYACIAVGQMAKKNKILAAVGVYFAYYLFTQIMGTVLIIVIMLLGDTGFLTVISDFIDNYPNAALAMGIVYYLVQSVLFFAVANVITRKKLNLE